MTDCSDDKKFEEALESLDFMASLGMGILCINSKGENTVEPEETIDSLTKKLAEEKLLTDKQATLLSIQSKKMDEMNRVIGDTSALISHLKEELNRINNITHYREYLETLASDIRDVGVNVVDIKGVNSPTNIVRDAVKGVCELYARQIATTKSFHEDCDKLRKWRDDLDEQLTEARKTNHTDANIKKDLIELIGSVVSRPNERPLVYSVNDALKEDVEHLIKCYKIALADNDIPSEIDSSSGIVSMSRADYDALMDDLNNQLNSNPILQVLKRYGMETSGDIDIALGIYKAFCGKGIIFTNDNKNVLVTKDEWEKKNKLIDELENKLNSNPLLNILHTRGITTAEEVAELVSFYDKNRGKKLMDSEPVHLKDLAEIVNAHVVFDSEKTTAQNILEGVAYMGKMIVRLTESENLLRNQVYDLNNKCSLYGREKLAYERLADTLENSVEYLKVIHAQEMMLANAESNSKPTCAHESCATACLAEEISLIDNMEQD